MKAVILSALLGASPTSSAASENSLRAVFYCMLAKRGSETPNKPNFSFLLKGDVESVAPEDHIVTADPQHFLNGASLSSFNRTGQSTFAVLTGKKGETGRIMLSLTPNKNGQWHDAALGQFGKSERPSQYGACFLIRSPDAEADFLSHPPVPQGIQ